MWVESIRYATLYMFMIKCIGIVVMGRSLKSSNVKLTTKQMEKMTSSRIAYYDNTIYPLFNVQVIDGFHISIRVVIMKLRVRYFFYRKPSLG